MTNWATTSSIILLYSAKGTVLLVVGGATSWLSSDGFMQSVKEGERGPIIYAGVD